MTKMISKIKGVAAAAALLSVGAMAGVGTDLAYPSGKLTDPNKIMENVYFVNHFFGFKNYSIQKVGRDITVIVKKSQGEKPLTETVERYLNNDYANDANIRSRDLAVFRAGKLRGTGMLITDYKDDAKSQEYLLWLPALRKIRRFAQPAHDEAWGGTDFTFGDVTLRKPMHEKHTLMGTQTFGMDVQSLVIPAGEQTALTKGLPAGTGEFKGREVYKVKSETKFSGWWYDYRISYVDTKTYGDYHVEYYKGGKLIKIIDKNWKADTSEKDPRALKWYAWYGHDLRNGHESLAYIPLKVTKKNEASFKVDGKNYSTENLWTQQTLSNIKR
ncbi:MAG: hypothetical protein RLZZ428_716 [Pseudomonadota bacterium]